MSQKNCLQLIDSPWRVAGFTALVYFIYLFIYLSFSSFNLSGFIWFGEKFIHAEEMPIEISGKISPYGYDGQFYYRLALDPFTTRVEDYGIKLDIPVYRQQRILYPLFVHILSFGNPQRAVFL